MSDKDRQPTSAKDIGNVTLGTDEIGIWLIDETPAGPQQMGLVTWEVIAKYVRRNIQQAEFIESMWFEEQ